MAGFLRKKSRQDSRTKPSQVSPPPVTSTTPVYARFASSNNALQEPQRIISSPMVLSSTRKDAAPAPHNRGGRTVAGNSVNVVHRDSREIEARRQQNQFNLAAHIPETQHDHGSHQHGQYPQSRQPQLGSATGNGVGVVRHNTQDMEARRRWNQPSPTLTPQNDGGRRSSFLHHQHVQPPSTQIEAHARGRPVSRIRALDKPLPPPLLPSHANSFSLNSPTTPTQASVLQNGRSGTLRTPVTLGNKPLPRPSVSIPENPSFRPRPPIDHATDPETPKPHQTFNVTSPPDFSALTVQPQPRRSTDLPIQGFDDPPISSLLNNQTKPLHPSDPDRPQTLSPRPSHRSLSRQDLQSDENGSRSGSGASTSQGSLIPDDALAAQHQRLLEALQLTAESNKTDHKSKDFKSLVPVTSSNTLPQISFSDVSVSSCLSLAFFCVD